ncbi:MAG TPA: outer membrane protein [Rhizobiaceae bacterium]
MRLLSAAISIALMSGPAMASDHSHEALAAFNWTGFVAGVNAGYGWGDADYRFITNGYYNAHAGDSYSHGIDGAFLGGHVRYNYQIDNVVLGMEGALFLADIGKTVPSPHMETDSFETSVDWFSTLTPRIGYAVDRAHIFAKGGLALGKVKNTMRDNYTGGFETGSSTRTGWTAGGGVEYAVTNNVLLGLEYNYTDLGALAVNTGMTDFDTNHRVDTAFSAVSLTLGYKF